MRASMIEYLQYMRLTDPLAVKPKFYAKEWLIDRIQIFTPNLVIVNIIQRLD
jgi:hypothetical protein